jgi:hypothetical protein
MACVTVASTLCRFYRVPAGFNKASVRSAVIVAVLGRQWRRPEPALLADRSADHWDANQQVLLPLAY